MPGGGFKIRKRNFDDRPPFTEPYYREEEQAQIDALSPTITVALMPPVGQKVSQTFGEVTANVLKPRASYDQVKPEDLQNAFAAALLRQGIKGANAVIGVTQDKPSDWDGMWHYHGQAVILEPQ